MKKDPAIVTRWKHNFGFHNRGVQWDTPDVEMGWRREGLDTAHDAKPARQGGRDDQPPEMMKQPTEKNNRKVEAPVKKKPRDVSPLVIENPQATRN